MSALKNGLAPLLACAALAALSPATPRAADPIPIGDDQVRRAYLAL